MPISQQLRDKIKNELKRRKWSQEDLHQKTGVAQSTISKIITGTTEYASTKTLDIIADALGFKIEIRIKEK